MPVIGIGGQAAGRPRRWLGALLVTAAGAAGASVAGGAAAAAAAAGTPYAYVVNEGTDTVSAYDAATGTVTVTATIPVGTGPYGVAATTVPPASNKADVSAALACPAAMTTGSTGSCTLTVANAGPATAVSVNAVILLPAQLKQRSCTPACGLLGNAVTWTLASLASGGSASFAVTVAATDRGSVTVAAAAVARSPDPNLRNNTAAAKVVITRPGH